VILLDTDVLSAFAKIGKIDLLYQLFSTSVLYISPSVLEEVKVSYDKKYPFAMEIFQLIEKGRIKVVVLKEKEIYEKERLPIWFGEGEKESIILCLNRGGVLLSNEKKVKKFCEGRKIVCLRTPGLLKALIDEGIIEVKEAKRIIENLKNKDKMEFTESTLKEILGS